MARKKKKRLTRKEQKAQRQAAIAGKRKQKGWQPPQARARQNQQELIDDMLPLFPLVGETKSSPEAGLERLMMALMDSADLIDEPEFEDLIIDPLLCVDTFIGIGEELGVDPEEFRDLPDEEVEDSQFDLLEKTIQRLLTDQVRRDIDKSLNELRLRLKRSRKPEKVAQVAALQTILNDKGSREIWPGIGLVNAIFQRSLAAGFELLQMSMEAEALDTLDQPATLSQKLAQSSLVQKTDALLKKIPGLSGFLEKQADKIWEEGEEAVFKGELYLELFTEEELEAAAEIFAEVLELETTEGVSSEEINRPELTQARIKTLISRVDDYVTGLFTPERMSRLEARLNEAANDPSYPEKWLSFRLMLAEYMAHEDAIENEKRFLIWALIGEMRAVQQLLFEEAETE